MDNRAKTKRIGNLGEIAAMAKLAEMEIPIYMQIGDAELADLIILVDNQPLKIQVKTTTTYNGICSKFDLTSRQSYKPRTNLKAKRHIYSQDEIDAFICYDAVTKKLFIVENDMNRVSFWVRYSKTKNNQSKKVNYYEDYLLCVETLHEIALKKVKEKVQTTMWKPM